MPRLHRQLLVLATVVFAALIGLFALRDPFLVDEGEHLRGMTLHSARGVASDIAADMRDRVIALTRLTPALAAGSDPSSGASPAVDQFFDTYPSYVVMHWVDPERAVRSTFHRDGRAPATPTLSLRTSPVRDAVQSAATGRHAVFSTTFAHEQDGRPMTAVVVPIESGGGVRGFIVGAIDVERLIAALVSDQADLGFVISVVEATRELYCTRPDDSRQGDEWAQELPIPLAGTSWRARVWPEPHTVRANRSALPEITLAIAGLFAFALVVMVHGARAERSRAMRLTEARDDLERRVAERTAELSSANESLRDLSGRLLQLQDEERRRIALELHDSTVQTLAACAVSIESARIAARAGRPGESEQSLADALASIDAATKDVRTLSYLLHPPVLEELGLAEAITWYAEGFSARSGIRLTVDVPHSLERLPRELEVTLFRIVQEALTNVHRHSGSDSARLVLARTADSVVLEIEDYGRGLPADLAKDLDRVSARLGVGLAGMRERVRQLAGTIEIANTARGVSIRTVLPIESA